MKISDTIVQIIKEIPQEVTLVAVSKTKPIEDIWEAYNAGQRIFGENKVQELAPKYEALPKDIQWHMIGHMQSNKVKYISSFVSLIHSVDSLKLLEVINKEAQKHKRVIDCLLQIHIASEETKFGLDRSELMSMFETEAFTDLHNVRICGLMGMATYTDDTQKIRNEFASLVTLFKEVKENYFKDKPEFKEISMGMSEDYKIAIEQGSTMIRLGSILFGERNYSDKD